MSRHDMTVPTGFWPRFRRAIPLLAILAAFVWSCITIASRRAAEAPANAIVIRIGHWQLEAGVRTAFEKLGKDFSDHPAIRAKYGNRPIVIIQDAIPEGTYGQWATSQMMGETAPDLVEVGNGLSASLWLQFQTRYFVPLTDIANAPNPFNAITQQDRDELDALVRGRYADGREVPAELRLTPAQAAERLAFYGEMATLPVRATCTDGMRNGYQEELQEYMRFPLSRFSIRLFYNKDLLKKLAGVETPPTDLAGFLKVCRQISAKKNPEGNNYVPIASSDYNMSMWMLALFNSMTYDAIVQADFNRDGTVGSDETYAAFHTGRLDFYSPPIKARFDVTRDIMRQFQNGFTGLTRDDAVFVFAQQNAVFIATGTWDAGSLVKLAHGNFGIGVMRMPQPTPDDPSYGRLIVGPVYDAVSGAGFPFGLTRFSKNQDCAKDFLLFLSSRRANEEMNSIIGWLPVVRGGALPSLLKGFDPVNQGMYGAFDPLGLGGRTNVRFTQCFGDFQTNPKYTYDSFVKDFAPFYNEQGLEDWTNQQRDWRRAIYNNEKLLASLRGQALEGGATPQDPSWVKYRVFTATRQVTPEISRAVQERIVRQGPDRPVGPYEFLDLAKQNIRKNAAAPAAGADGGGAP